MERRESWDRWSATLRPAHWSWFICQHLPSVSHSYSLLSKCNPEILLSSIFYDQVQSVFQAFVQISPEPIHALAISGVIRSFKSTLASTNNSFALFKLQNSSYLFPKTDGSTFIMVFINDDDESSSSTPSFSLNLVNLM